MSMKPIRLIDLFRYYKALPHQQAALGELEDQIKHFCPDCFDRDQDWYRTWASAVPPKGEDWLISRYQVAKVSGHNEALFDDAFMDDLNHLVRAAGMTSVNQRIMLLAQTCHETGGFRWMKELADGTAYNNRSDLGNGPNDGPKFKGAGAIQLTGRYNYQRFSDWLIRKGMRDPKVMSIGCDYVANRYPFLSAICWIEENNWAAICDRGNIHEATRVLNGGYNGISSRMHYHQLACKYITD
jgi:predicted chitinase